MTKSEKYSVSGSFKVISSVMFNINFLTVPVILADGDWTHNFVFSQATLRWIMVLQIVAIGDGTIGGSVRHRAAKCAIV